MSAKTLELYAIVDDGELYYETLADTPRKAIDVIDENRQNSDKWADRIARMMCGRLRVHCVRVTIMDEPSDYFIRLPTGEKTAS